MAVVIVQYGPEAPCATCLESVRSSSGVSIHCGVVDHDPVSSSRIEAVARGLGGFYIHDPSNPGFAAGANCGIRAASVMGDFEAFVVLNADVRLEPDCLRKLCESLRRDGGIGIAGPGLLWDARPGCWWNVGSEIRWPSGRPVSLLHGQADPGEDLAVMDTDFVAGAVLAISPKAWNLLGGLNEDYFLYFEDADLAFRAREAGFRVVVDPSARAWHLGGGSTTGLEGALAYYRTRNRLIFSRRWNPHPVWGPHARGCFALRQASRSILRFLGTGRSEELASFLGVLDHFRRRLGKRRPGLT